MHDGNTNTHQSQNYDIVDIETVNQHFDLQSQCR